MDTSAQKKTAKVLITNVATNLGSRLAAKLTSQGYEVYGTGRKHPQEKLLESSNFTFLDIDLAQPFPEHLPRLDTIVHISTNDLGDDETGPANFSTDSKKLIDLAGSSGPRILFLAKITDIEKIIDYCQQTARQHPKFVAVGHLYGPHMKLESALPQNTAFFENNELANLISQAVLTDKIVLENEGTDIIYPAFIDDAIENLIHEINAEKLNTGTTSLTSSEGQSALALSYEIQKQARLLLHKELNIYFAGPQAGEKPRPQTQLRIHSHYSLKRHPFDKGLEETLLYFRELEPEVKITPDTPKEEKPLLPTASPSVVSQQKVEEKSQKIRFRKNVMPRFPGAGTRFKKFALVFLFILFITFARQAVNLTLGARNMEAAKESLTSANFQLANQKSQNATRHFSSAQKSVDFLTSPIKFIDSVKQMSYGIQSLTLGASALSNLAAGTEIVARNLSTITSNNPSKTNLDLETPMSYLNKAYFESEQATVLAQSATGSFILKSQFKKAQEAFHYLSVLSRSAQELTVLTPDITGNGQDKTYLVLLTNNAELRPGGGFIGNFAEISFKNNKLDKIEVEDIYTIDGQLKEVIDPPPQLTQKLGVKQLYLRDSNWSTDFRTNAQTARDLFKKETGKTVDGVITLDLTLLENLLSKIGPIRLADYNEEITSSNLLEKGQYYSEVGFFPGSTQKRDFFATLTASLLAKIFDSLSSGDSQVGNAPWVALMETMSQGLEEKHVMLTLDNQNLNALIRSKGWDNPTPPQNYNPKDNTGSTRDFLAISEANIGANKVNRYLKREIAYDMTIGRDADLVATLTLTYKNESPADTWPGGTYVNYLRIMAPLESTLEEYSENGKKVDINRFERGKIVPIIETTQAGELTQFATLVEVPVKETKTLTFKYRIPKNIKLETAPTYELYVSKQPGTLHDPLKFTFNLPGYLKIGSVDGNEDAKGKQNLTHETNLSVDRHWEIKISKK